jgi:cyclopropane fatty-acyl-phospholipid synthase-like methyltransferase
MKTLCQVFFLFFLGLSFTACLDNNRRHDREETELIDPKKGEGKTSAGIREDYVNTNRVIWQKPEFILERLGDVSQKVVADIGAGRGFFALRIAPKAKKVIAIDIDPNITNYLDSIRNIELSAGDKNRLEARLARPDDPSLKLEEADKVLIVNTYMYIINRVDYLSTLKKGMSKGASIIIVDFKKKRTNNIGPPVAIRVPQYTVEDELERAGFELVDSDDLSLDYQYIIVARKP